MKWPESVNLELRAPSAQVERYGSVGMNPPIHCFFPLSTEEASREYELLARKLSEAGRLTLARHRALSSYALQVDCIVKAKSEGRELRASWLATLDRARSQLKLEQLDDPIPRSAPPNKFAHCGFSNRSRAGGAGVSSGRW